MKKLKFTYSSDIIKFKINLMHIKMKGKFNIYYFKYNACWNLRCKGINNFKQIVNIL